MLETYRGVVYPWQCDMFEHQNIQFYVAKFDEAAWQFMSMVGIATSYLKNEQRAMVAMEQNIRYYKELVAGDLVTIRAELIEVRRKSINFRLLMYNTETDEVAAEMNVIAVHMDTITRESCNFPLEIKLKLEAALD